MDSRGQKRNSSREMGLQVQSGNHAVVSEPAKGPRQVFGVAETDSSDLVSWDTGSQVASRSPSTRTFPNSLVAHNVEEKLQLGHVEWQFSKNRAGSDNRFHGPARSGPSPSCCRPRANRETCRAAPATASHEHLPHRDSVLDSRDLFFLGWMKKTGFQAPLCKVLIQFIQAGHQLTKS